MWCFILHTIVHEVYGCDPAAHCVLCPSGCSEPHWIHINVEEEALKKKKKEKKHKVIIEADYSIQHLT